MASNPSVRDQQRLRQEEQGPEREQQAVEVQHRRTVEGAPCDLQPIRAEEAAECDGDEQVRHRDVKFADRWTALRDRDGRHAHSPADICRQRNFSAKRPAAALYSFLSRGRR